MDLIFLLFSSLISPITSFLEPLIQPDFWKVNFAVNPLLDLTTFSPEIQLEA